MLVVYSKISNYMLYSYSVIAIKSYFLINKLNRFLSSILGFGLYKVIKLSYKFYDICLIRNSNKTKFYYL